MMVKAIAASLRILKSHAGASFLVLGLIIGHGSAVLTIRPGADEGFVVLARSFQMPIWPAAWFRRRCLWRDCQLGVGSSRAWPLAPLPRFPEAGLARQDQ
jgi:hypothetical protein